MGEGRVGWRREVEAMIRRLTDQPEHSNSGCLRFKCSSVRESKPVNTLPIHELSAVNNHCLRFKYGATARLSWANNRTDFYRLGHFEECTGFDIRKDSRRSGWWAARGDAYECAAHRSRHSHGHL